MKSCWKEMIWWKLQNIEELEADKAKQASETAAVSFLNDFLLNVSSDQIEVSLKFDSAYWSENALFESTS